MFRIISLTILIPTLAMATDAFAQHSDHGQTKSPKLSQTKATTAKPAPKKDEPRTAVEVPTNQQASIGVSTAEVKKGPVQYTIRTVGAVAADQRTEAHVHVRINGWIEKVYADFVGREVKKGEPLFDLYSPELLSTQEELLSAKRRSGIGREVSKMARERLRLWGVPESEIAEIEKNGKSRRSLTFHSPVNGFVINKTAIQGMYVTPEMELYYIADLSKIWVLMSLYEFDLSVVKVGDTAQISFPYDPNKKLQAKISYIYPEIDQETRTAKARVELANPKQELKPGMFTNVELQKDLGEAIAIPDDSVIDTGARKIVFVKSSETRFEPREVVVGPRVENRFVILSGLRAGERIVTGSHFLIDTESKLQAALQKGGATQQGHGSHGAQKKDGK